MQRLGRREPTCGRGPGMRSCRGCHATIVNRGPPKRVCPRSDVSIPSGSRAYGRDIADF
jgi:hypothetical protein